MGKMLEAVTLSELQDHLKLVRSTDEGQREGRSSKMVSCACSDRTGWEGICLVTVPTPFCHYLGWMYSFFQWDNNFRTCLGSMVYSSFHNCVLCNFSSKWVYFTCSSFYWSYALFIVLCSDIWLFSTFSIQCSVFCQTMYWPAAGPLTLDHT